MFQKQILLQNHNILIYLIQNRIYRLVIIFKKKINFPFRLKRNNKIKIYHLLLNFMVCKIRTIIIYKISKRKECVYNLILINLRMMKLMLKINNSTII